MDNPIDVTVVLLAGGWVSTSLGPIEVLHAAGRLWNGLQGEPAQPRFRVRTASVDGRAVPCAYGVSLMPQCRVADVARTDLVVVGAPGPELLDSGAYDPLLIDWLRAMRRGGAQIAGVCSGVAYLAAAGLLDGRRATTHWAIATLLKQRYPLVRWQPERFVTEDHGLYCGGGVYSSIDLSLYLVEKLCGRSVALEAARALLVSMPRTSQASYDTVPISRPHEDERIRQVEDILQHKQREGMTVEALAQQVGMSPRTLARRFKAATGQLPGAYLQHLRIARARELLEAGALPIRSVASSVGYDDLPHFRQVFKRLCGVTPADYRRRFGPIAVAPARLRAS